MNMIREGPQHLILQCEDCERTFNALHEIFPHEMALKKSPTMYDAYLSMIGLLDDSSTVLMLSLKMKSKLTFKDHDFEYLTVINQDSEDILINLVSYKEKLKIQKIRSTPHLIVMRTTGDDQKYINTVNRDIKGEIIAKEDMFENYGGGSIIIFTDKKIWSALGFNDFNRQAIYSEIKYNKLNRYLNNHRVKFVNASIDNKDWSELIIKIYDSYERYDLHYERLSMILNALDCGLILGESWGKDAALAYLSVGVYQVRLFTYLPPLEIKKIVLALEYDSHGGRIVDYDLFTKRKKYYWTQVRTEKIKKRDDLGLYYRRKLMAELNEDTVFELLYLEHQLT